MSEGEWNEGRYVLKQLELACSQLYTKIDVVEASKAKGDKSKEVDEDDDDEGSFSPVLD